jgi:MFS superfamily sulfate permease-like transporter
MAASQRVALQAGFHAARLWQGDPAGPAKAPGEHIVMPIKILSNLRGDLFGGLTAAVVALPLALAFGVASGAGAIAGLYGAIAVGFFASIFGGTRTQVSGPTGPMTVVMAAVVAQYANNLPEAFGIVILGGAFQVVFGLARVGRFVSYTPYSVVSGFMSGIGIIIIVIQTLPFFGIETAPGGPLGSMRAWPEVPAMLNPEALAIAVASLATMIFWPKRAAGVLPPPLAALTLGTLMSVLLLPSAPVIGEVPTGLPDLVIPVFPMADLPKIVQAALVLALLGSIDSLLTSLVADSITRTRHKSDRELIGQGIGNMAAGLIGGLPGAGATMRTVINARRRAHAAVRGDPCGGPAGAAAGAGPAGGTGAARSTRRYPDEGRLGYHRLELPAPYPSCAARQGRCDAGDPGPDGLCRPDHRRRRRPDPGRFRHRPLDGDRRTERHHPHLAGQR